MLAQVRGRRWLYGSRGWTFPPVFCCILLPCDRWQQKDSLTKWHLTLKWVWSKGVPVNSSMRKKNGSHCYLLNVYGNQTVDMTTVRKWVVPSSSGDSNVEQATFWMATYSCHIMTLSVSISSSAWIDGIQPENWAWSWILASTHWELWWQQWNITKFAPCVSYKCLHRNIKNIVYQDLLSQ